MDAKTVDDVQSVATRPKAAIGPLTRLTLLRARSTAVRPSVCDSGTASSTWLTTTVRTCSLLRNRPKIETVTIASGMIEKRT